MWTESEEEKWKKLTKKREKNKEDVGRQQTIEMLKGFIKSLEEGKPMPGEINIEYIRQDEGFYGSFMPNPVIGKVITLIYK